MLGHTIIFILFKLDSIFRLPLRPLTQFNIVNARTDSNL